MIRFFKEGWLVLVMMVGCGALLAVMEASLAGKIEGAKKELTRRAVSKAVLRDSHTIAVEERPIAGNAVFRVTDISSGQLIGWAVTAKAAKPDPSYSGKLDIMIGLDGAGEKIIGLAIIESNESPTQNARISSDGFRGRFIGKSARTADDPLIRDGGGSQAIEGISGATVSVKAIIGAVNRKLAEVQKGIAESAGQVLQEARE